MTQLICLASHKGGVGKTTVCVNLAVALYEQGYKTMIADCDTQQRSACDWASLASQNGHEGPPVVALNASALRRDLPRISAGYDLVICDTPGHAGTEMRAALILSDLCIVPVAPGGFDVWAAHQTLTVLEEARALRPELLVRFLFNRAERTVLSRVARGALEELGEVYDVALSQRQTHGRAVLAGQGVCAFDPKSQAALEVRRLARAVLADLHMPSKPKEVAA